MGTFPYRDRIEPLYNNFASIDNHQRDAAGVLFTGKDEESGDFYFRIDVISSAIFRIRTSCNPVKERKSYVLAEDRLPDAHFTVEERGDALIIDTGENSFYMNLQNARYSIIAKERDFTLRQSHKGAGCRKTDNIISLRETIQMNTLPAQQEHFFGFGERFGSTEMRGRSQYFWHRDWFNSRGDQGYKHVPFFISSRGYGIFLHSLGKLVFRMGDESQEYYSFEAEDEILDYFIIIGSSMKEVLSGYTMLTGRTPMVPRWAYGVWWSNENYASQKEIEEICTRLREEGYPADVINIDHFFWATGYNSFEWNKNFPKPKEMIKKLKKLNYRICLWETPFINLKTEENRLDVVDDKCSLYDEAEENGYLLKDKKGKVNLTKWWWGKGAYVDFTNPDAAQWWKDLHLKLLKQGIDTFKTDDGEYVQEEAVFTDGATGTQLHNIYALLYNKTVFEAVAEGTKGPGIVWARSGYAGSQRYPVCWSGDQAVRFEFLESNVRGGLNLGMSGFSAWSHDIGGFIGTPTPELFIRWTQFGTFSPFFRVHGTGRREPWLFDEEIQKLYKKYAKLRIRLFPFIYSIAYHSNEKGLPMMRHMALEFPHDKNAYDKDTQYMFGRCMLVAPMYSGENSRDIYLPPGRWFDFWDKGVSFSGGGIIRYEAELDRIPVIAKEGAMVPLMPEMQHIDEKKCDPLTIKIFPGRRGVFALYEEEGLSRLSYERDESRYVFDCGGRFRDYIIDIMSNDYPDPIPVSKERLKEFDGKVTL